MSAPLRWGIIEPGASPVHSRAIFASSTKGRGGGGISFQASADAFGDEFDVANRHGSYEALVADPEVDAVYVATPHPMHYDNASLALEHDKPVLVEKAFTMTGVQARGLVSVARSKGLFMMEAMWTRFLPHVVAVRELLAEGALGEIVSVSADHGQCSSRIRRRVSSRLNWAGSPARSRGLSVSFASMVLGTPAE